MAQQAVPSPLTPRDPLRGYNFRLKIATGGVGGDGSLAYIAGVRSVSGLGVTIRPFEVYQGGNNLHRYAQPDKITWDPITLEQGLAIGKVLHDWAMAVLAFATTGMVGAQPIKRNVQLDVLDEAQNVRLSYLIHNAWLSKYQPIPKLDAMGGAEAGIQTIELTHEGWEEQTPGYVALIPNPLANANNPS